MAKPGIESLNTRDLLILQLLGDNFSTKDIAFKLGLSPKTVEYHIDSGDNPRCIATKLSLRGKGRTALVRFAVEHKLVTPAEKPKPVLDAITITGLDSLQQSVCQVATLAAKKEADPVQCSCVCQAAEAFVKIERLRMAIKTTYAE